ncbi:unnamed protein product [Paramecium sonneborni]|uniref:Uncharacterized protein n=1 Tax=Paramecium sonneborni TaxID=65129 RepID=A0A8S1QYM9_9CILI|nr:unnamed protein product [Paramecium sonneborni]
MGIFICQFNLNLLNYIDGESSSVNYIRIIDTYNIITPSFPNTQFICFIPSYVIIFLGKITIYANLINNQCCYYYQLEITF